MGENEKNLHKAKHVMDESSPLLPRKESDVEHVDGASFTGSVFNLSTNIVGAVIMALPATMKLLGLGLGIPMVIFAAFVTEASIELLLRFSKAGNSVGYAEVMGDAFGRTGRILLQICVVINNIGILIAYMIIIGDVLSGTSSSGVHHSGILEGWFGAHWWNERAFVLLITTLFVFIPLTCFKHMDMMAACRLGDADHVGINAQYWYALPVILGYLQAICSTQQAAAAQCGGCGGSGLAPFNSPAAIFIYLTISLIAATLFIPLHPCKLSKVALLFLIVACASNISPSLSHILRWMPYFACIRPTFHLLPDPFRHWVLKYSETFWDNIKKTAFWNAIKRLVTVDGVGGKADVEGAGGEADIDGLSSPSPSQANNNSEEFGGASATTSLAMAAASASSASTSLASASSSSSKAQMNGAEEV